MASTSPMLTIERVQHACRAMALDCTSDQATQLLRYISEMQKWNKTYNLTALREPEKMLVQHIFDSLSVVPYLSPWLANAPGSDQSTSRKLCDIGSGGGLPGVVIAVMTPHCAVQCIDAVEKKTAFVRQMVGAVGLPNLTATHSRVEQLPEQNADIVISRAFASLVDFATLSSKHVNSTGWLVGMKGKMPDDEIDALHAQTDWQVDHIDSLVVPELNAQRCLVWMRRKKGNP